MGVTGDKDYGARVMGIVLPANSDAPVQVLPTNAFRIVVVDENDKLIAQLSPFEGASFELHPPRWWRWGKPKWKRVHPIE